MVKTTVVLGASDKEDRYSNKAVAKLIECGHDVIPVNTAGKIIHGIKSIRSVNEVTDKIDTLTMYVNPKISSEISEDILKLPVRRVIFNPGTENDELEAKLCQKGVEVIKACTLVMLATNQY